ncbi:MULTISPECIES: M18 family aminopeptidase [unclassified Rathayibacter]|uniref:M18 family aminopeptidase n=1 Tax=unclassified Rathayibacter TaxID=2609250 RepID=UPI000CE91453|nr:MULTISPECIES: M18 family aminopeptidase [unclassified Rathayibacter]PPF28376.1 M18 family aminopeptidase [Rathayibacter sp. AY1F2]PPG57416.1 M18 family aminopeptidase [Rathayibacter sp. AY1C5]PPH05257.1 M18 family aminopeptidase [Rathayibacter sp. AY1F6]PPH08622.1 M18 family aminopeptidase [Rathayibacter sp. AY1H3]PPH48413.1 M18 family aminopeptidase [Rathayibacter sp. AY1F7]
MTTRDDHIADFAEFLTASPSSYHAAAEAARRLEGAGFTGLDETQAWPAGPGRYYVVRDGAIIAWHLPEGSGATTPFRILGAHTDSPGFMLKPRPTIGSKGWLQAGVEIYGGPLLNSWLDRELELAGRVVTRDGSTRLLRTGPLLRIPQLAIHLDRTANEGLTLDRQKHTVPVFGIGDASEVDLLQLLAAHAGLDDASDIAGYDLLTADTQAPRRFGLDEMLLAAGRMDDLSSVHAGLVALLAASADPAAPPAHISVLAAFDHEELGSASRSGASGPFLEDVLSRIGTALGAGVDERARAIAASWCLSADAGHSVHPNYSEKHDPANQPVAGKGPLLKINATQRYATDARGAALWAGVCERAGVGYQEFVSNNSVPCGSTIGPLTATRLGISTVDVGVPLLSMHSARELAHVDDLVALTAAIEAFFTP